MHFLSTIFTPHSSYSVLAIHILLNPSEEQRIEPPSQVKNFLSGEAITFTSSFIGLIAKYLISFVNLSGNPLNKEFPLVNYNF